MKLTYDEFFDQYRPVVNHLQVDAPWDGCLFETFGEELKHVTETHQKTHSVWTMIEDGNVFVTIPGFWMVNRMGYFITEVPWSIDEFHELEITEA